MIISQIGLRTCLFLTIIAYVCGCEDFGGGVAGGGFDSASKKEAADRFPNTISCSVCVAIQNHPDGFQPRQHFDDSMRTFPFNKMRVVSKPSNVYGTSFTAQYRRNKFTLRDENGVRIEQNLPDVFNMHPVRVGIGTLGGREVIMIVNKSRASTGRYFVAIWGMDGEVLYRKVHRAYEVWDILADGEVINLIGAKGRIRISLKDEDCP